MKAAGGTMGIAIEPPLNSGQRTAARFGSALDRNRRRAPATAQQYQRLADEDRGTGGLSTADGLGYFSLALGLAEVLAPHAMSRLIGV
ncbi:MAG TPA: hypothetical protein VIG47_16325, partial [Gemmatimonadaceae bacterium]